MYVSKFYNIHNHIELKLAVFMIFINYPGFLVTQLIYYNCHTSRFWVILYTPYLLFCFKTSLHISIKSSCYNLKQCIHVPEMNLYSNPPLECIFIKAQT